MNTTKGVCRMSTSKTFGAFFRDSRKALGLTLSEFCRRNGFDKGNVSRLERGLVPPPRARELLESYAKALKLESGTVARDRFFELAAAETGRIPADLLVDQQTIQKLPSLYRGLRTGGQGHTNWVRALDLQTWADTFDSRATLPQVVRRLIRATGKAIGPMEFPAHEQVQRPGWDGIVEAGAADAFVPEGTSAWELGVEKDHRKKAEDDFVKRTKDPLGLDREKTTIVFVTLRKWQKKEEWRRAKQALGIWKEVRVYDSATLEEWLEQSPAVDAWLAGIVEPPRKPIGVIVIDDYWANLQSITNPSLKPEVFLASGDNQIVELKKWLDGPPGAMVIEARSPVEAVDFVAGFSRDPAQAEWFGARALIVESRDAWRSVAAAADAELLLIAHPALSIEPELVAEAVRQGHRVLVSSNQAPREPVSSLKLPRAYRHDLEKALVSSGLDAERARTCAREAGGSLTVLKRLLGRYPGTTQPEWSRPAEAAALVPMLLAGSWDGTSEGDRSAIEKLSGHPYRDVDAIADRWRMAPDSPLAHIGSHWSLVSRDDSWHLLASAVTADHFHRFEEVAMEVLAEDDPIYELPLAQRWIARRDKKEPRYSQTLRNGLAETLAILGTRPERLPHVPGIEGRIEHVVRLLLDRQEWLRWVSLSDQLPLLAEAGPEAFLGAVERDLGRPESALVKLFEQEGSLSWTTSRHAALLWALEALAWNRDWLPRVSLILGTLDEKTPREKLGNSPSRSLLEIFTPWLPQTTAPVEERVGVLKKLAKSRRDAGWRLLVGLLPNQRPMTMHHRPLWRDWAIGWSTQVPSTDYWHQVVACALLLVEHLDDDIERWKALIDQYDNLPGPVQTKFLERLNGFAESALDEGTRRAVSDAIRAKVSLHRKYASTKWALPGEILAELENVQRRYEPADPVRRYAWLFVSHWQVLEIREHLEKPADELRRSALQEILDQGGWEGIQRLIQEVETPEAVGIAFAEIGSRETDATILPALLTPADEKAFRFAGGYIQVRFRKEGRDWVDRLKMDHWSSEEIARFLAFLPFERRTWEFAAEKGDEVSSWYWNNPPIFPRGEEGDDASYAVTMLLRHKRPFQAFLVLQTALHRNVRIESSLFMNAIETWLETGAGGVGRIQGLEFLVLSLFQELQKRVEQKDPGVDRNGLAKLEWACLDLLDGHPTSPVTLHGLLQDDAEFFVQVLGLIYRPKNEPTEGNTELSEEEKRRAQNAYRLIRSWQDVPGSRDDQTVDEIRLLGWVQRARSLAKDRGLLEICDSRIGEVFAYAPHEEDGSWPCIPVRDALEEIGTDKVFAGFGVGIYNKRGVVSKSLREGGDQERKLAEKYRAFADASKIEWPKTAAALRRIAMGYEEDARREDAQLLLSE
jgi:transcriptional regulator with XRE-family HTH domain